MSQNQFFDDLYEDQVFRSLSMDRQEITAVTFSACAFTKCSFEEAAFTACRFQDCTFKNCNLNLAKVDGTAFRTTRFESSKLVGVNWAKAAWGKSGARQIFASIDFFDCVLNYSSFTELSLPKINMKKCTARDVDFSEANLQGADFSFTDFTNSQFRHTNLAEANFAGAANYSIHPSMNVLKKTRFSLPEALSLLYNLDIEIVEVDEAENQTGKED
jgi:fluoroquinolone resistance protein